MTSSIGGKGLQIGLTPHKSGISASVSDINFGQPEARENSSASTVAHAIYAATNGFLTGAAGELAYSTKPTIFFYRTGSAFTDYDGYIEATASLQYHRHTFPYNTPFYATHKIRGRNPMYNSYEDFAEEGLKYKGRDYSIIPEFRISDDFDFYQQSFFSKDDFVNNPSLYSVEQVAELEYNEPKLKIRRNFGSSKDVENNPKNKTDFLKLDGATPNASADDSGGGSQLTFSKNVYDYDHISGPQLTIQKNAVLSYATSSTAVSFYEKYSHTDDLVNFTHLMSVKNGFSNRENTIPAGIKFTSHGLRKLLPYSGFYPVVRTTQIGTHFVDFISPYIERMTSDTTTQNAQQDQLPAYLQAYIEPLFGPGLLYNSIKSGIAVEYPVYTKDPHYYAPHSFLVSSHGMHTGSSHIWDSPAAPFADMRFHLEASQSFPYGGFQMLGTSRCIPSILNSRPDVTLPFEALYDASVLDQFDSKPLRLVTDFVDLDRNTSYPNTSGSVVTASGRTQGPWAADYPSAALKLGDYHPGLVVGDRDNNHPASTLSRKMSEVISANKNLYYSSINNFLCETMEFFLDDPEIPGVKLPIALSQPKSKEELQFNSAMSYYMDVSLHMGLHQVMSEGPRNAGLGGGEAIENDFAGSYKNAKMRGYIYGPPTEIIIHHPDGGGTLPIDPAAGRATDFPDQAEAGRPIFLADGTVSARTSSVPVKDYESYFAANLQDPAYQAYTPPYFYGKSSKLITYKFDTENFVSAYDLGVQNVFEHAQNNSFDLATYHTGSGRSRELIGLCKVSPHSASISLGAGERMGIEASIDIFNENNVISLKDPTQRTDDYKHMWYIAPKWVCPVLDFSSSVSVAELETSEHSIMPGSTYSYMYNTYHDNTTGKGMWAGYGTDPYDANAMDAVYTRMQLRDNDKISDITLAEKGIYLEIKTPDSVTRNKNTRNTTLETPRGEHLGDDPLIDELVIGTPLIKHLSASLATGLGFEEKKYQIGKMALEKSVSEAVVLIPYIEEPIRIVANKSGVISGGTKELYATRQIIPGKHFLPIHSNTFENVLSVILADRHYRGDESFFASNSIDTVLSTDVGRMIDQLIGKDVDGLQNNRSRKGYQLPPEFDFIHNKSVAPFQMIVMPMNDVLSKQDLLDIYQGVMPDASMKFKKIKSTPFRCRPNYVTEDQSWHTFADLSDQRAPTLSQSLVSLNDTLHTSNFLSPRGCLVETNNFFSELAAAGYFDIDSEEQIIPKWLRTKSSSKRFYKKLKFMVFKVKQQAEKDYSTYRKRQIAKAIDYKIKNGENRRLSMPDEYSEVLRNKKFNEVYGTNWPYDYFSLVESVKIDVEIEVD